MGLPADDMVDRLREQASDAAREDYELFEFEGASIRLLCELALTAKCEWPLSCDSERRMCPTCKCKREIRAAGLLPEEAERE